MGDRYLTGALIRRPGSGRAYRGDSGCRTRARAGGASGNRDDDIAHPKADGGMHYIRRVRSGKRLEWRRGDRQISDAVIDDELVGDGRTSAIGNQDRYGPKRRRRACSRWTALQLLPQQ